MTDKTLQVLVILVIIINHQSICFELKPYSNAILKNLDFKSPISIIGGNKSMIPTYAKHIYATGKYVTFHNHDQFICGVKIQGPNLVAFKDQKTVTLVISKHPMFDLILEKMECKINKEVYFLKETTKELFETFTINNIKTLTKIAWMDEDYKLIWLEDQDMIKRRSNFQGIYVKSLTGISGDNVKLEPSYLSQAPYFDNNGTYDVTNYASGVIIDILSLMTSALNFTTKYYRRRDRKVGAVKKYPNGTYGGIGIIPDLYHGKAEMIALAIVMKTSRIKYMDFLPPIDFTYGIKIVHMALLMCKYFLNEQDFNSRLSNSS